MSERGFTLIELLVVVLIIGVLAAIALPTFLGQRDKAHDSTAKQDLSNAVSQMASCFRNDERYVGCPDAQHELAAGVVVDITQDGRGYTLSRRSGSNTTFTIEQAGAVVTRSCSTPGTAGCRANGSW